MDTAQWPQDIGLVKPPMDQEMVSNTCSSRPNSMLERKVARPQKEQALNCPRCNSTNTKFCYYNNYSLTQPRYFCKTCRRYWTEGGSLRNVPVGGGSRKNKRSSSNSSSSTSSASASSKNNKLLPDHQLPSCSQSSTHHHQNPKIIEGQDLNIAFPIRQDYHNMSEFVELPNIHENNNNNNPSPSSTNSSSLSALELLRTGITSRGLNSFMPMPTPDSSSVYPSGFAMQDFKPTLNFGLDGLGIGVGVGGGYGNGTLHHQGVQGNNNGRISFPFEDLRQVSSTSTTEFDQNRGQGDSNGYWSGMLGGGSW